MYEEISRFYDSYGEREWARLEATAYGRIMYNCHMWFLSPHMETGAKMLDAGCGSGRFSVPAAEAGCKLTLLDISERQLTIAENKMAEHGHSAYYINASVTDMNMLENNSFDVAVCYGAVLNYLHSGVSRAVAELYRVTKPGGYVVISVNSRAGVLRMAASELNMPFCDFWGDPDKWGIKSVVSTGDETDWPGATHPPRHYFISGELRRAMEEAGLRDIVTGAAPSVITGQRKNAELAAADKTAWNTLLYTENKMFTEPGLADAGEFILAKGRK